MATTINLFSKKNKALMNKVYETIAPAYIEHAPQPANQSETPNFQDFEDFAESMREVKIGEAAHKGDPLSLSISATVTEPQVYAMAEAMEQARIPIAATHKTLKALMIKPHFSLIAEDGGRLDPVTFHLDVWTNLLYMRSDTRSFIGLPIFRMVSNDHPAAKIMNRHEDFSTISPEEIAEIMDALNIPNQFKYAVWWDLNRLRICVSMLEAILGAPAKPAKTTTIKGGAIDRFQMDITKASQSWLGLPSGEDMKVSVGWKGKPANIFLSLNDAEGATEQGELTFFDNIVLSRMASLFNYGNPDHTMTPAMIYRAIVGRKGKKTAPPKMEQAIIESVDKMLSKLSTVDYTEHLKTLGITEYKAGKIAKSARTERYLPAAKDEIVTHDAHGREFRYVTYTLQDLPIQYKYAQLVNQVITIPAQIADIKDVIKQKDEGTPAVLGSSISSNMTRILITEYLMKRVELMKNKKNSIRSYKITLSDMYAATGNADADKKERQAIRQSAELVLDYWTAINYIEGYATEKSGQIIKAYVIELAI